jgi:hypothetical protein
MNVNDNMITYTITRVETPGWFCYKLYIRSDINGANLSVSVQQENSPGNRNLSIRGSIPGIRTSD